MADLERVVLVILGVDWVAMGVDGLAMGVDGLH